MLDDYLSAIKPVTNALNLSAFIDDRTRPSTTRATLQFDSGERGAGGTTSVRNVTITIGDFVITADDATLEQTGIKLGANARVNLPGK